MTLSYQKALVKNHQHRHYDYTSNFIDEVPVFPST